MGVAFTLIVHLFIIFIICSIVGIIAGILTSCFAKHKRKQKTLFAIITPFILLYTWYFVALIASAVVSDKKGVDIGIGDTWYVPITEDYILLFIDIPELASIEKKKDGTILRSVSHIQHKGNYIWGKTVRDKPFVYNTETEQLEQLDNETYSIYLELSSTSEPIEAFDFYVEKRKNILGNSTTIINIASWIIAIILLIGFKKILFPKCKNDDIKNPELQ